VSAVYARNEYDVPSVYTWTLCVCVLYIVYIQGASKVSESPRRRNVVVIL